MVRQIVSVGRSVEIDERENSAAVRGGCMYFVDGSAARGAELLLHAQAGIGRDKRKHGLASYE
jgi:hypothetical protein